MKNPPPPGCVQIRQRSGSKQEIDIEKIAHIRPGFEVSRSRDLNIPANVVCD